MRNARCLKCGLVIQGVWRHGPPKACPACGFTRSDEVVARAKQHQDEAKAFAKKSRIGKMLHNMKKALFPKKEEPII